MSAFRVVIHAAVYDGASHKVLHGLESSGGSRLLAVGLNNNYAWSRVIKVGSESEGGRGRGGDGRTAKTVLSERQRIEEQQRAEVRMSSSRERA